MKGKINVLIIDDLQIFRQGLSQIVAALPFVDQVHEAKNDEEAAKAISAYAIDVVTLDLNFRSSTFDGFMIAAQLKMAKPDVKVIILTQHARIEDYEKLMFHQNVDGYLDKDIDDVEISKALQKVMDGEKYVEASIEHMLEAGKWMDISPRTEEVLKLLAKGLSQKMIGDSLCISPKTVETHIRNISQRLGVKNSVELIDRYTKYRMRFRENGDESLPPFMDVKREGT
ncbi:MAG: response regulator transcription factor [Leeuwenhoekiella sp.]